MMPMAANALKYSTPANLVPPMPAGGARPLPAPIQATPISSMPMMPPPSAPAKPPYSVRLQADGSSIFYIPSPDGNPVNDIILGKNDPPKLPKALQPAQPPAQ